MEQSAAVPFPQLAFWRAPALTTVTTISYPDCILHWSCSPKASDEEAGEEHEVSVGPAGREQGAGPGSAPRLSGAGAQGDGNVSPVLRKLCGHGLRRRYGHTSAVGTGWFACERWSREGSVRSCRAGPGGKEGLRPRLDQGSLLFPCASHKPSSGQLGHQNHFLDGRVTPSCLLHPFQPTPSFPVTVANLNVQEEAKRQVVWEKIRVKGGGGRRGGGN